MFARSVIAGVLVLELGVTAQGCPVCDLGHHAVPLVIEYHQQPVALVVEPYGQSPAVRRGRVVEVLRDATGWWRQNWMIDIEPPSSTGNTGRWLVIGNYNPATPDWSVVKSVSPEMIDFLRALPDTPAAAQAFLKYLVAHLTHPDEHVSNAAFDALKWLFSPPVSASRTFGELARRLPRDQIQRLVRNAKSSSERVGLYALMLGLCGNREDIPFLERLVTEAKDDHFRHGLDGVVAGYLLLAGERGLKTLDRTKIENRSAPFSEAYAALQALRYVWQYGEGRIPPERLKQSMRRLLHRTKIADVVIADLARWRDWEVMDDVVKLYGAKDFDVPVTRRAIVRYLFDATRDVPTGAKVTDPLPPHAAAAKRHLETLRGKDPKLFKDVERYLN